METHTCNPSTQDVDGEAYASLGYLSRNCLKNKAKARHVSQ